jgi:Papain family cysteine protease
MNNGPKTEAEYPYTATHGAYHYNKTLAIRSTVSEYFNVTPKSVHALQNVVAQQPTIVGVEAGQPVWQSYSGRIITCGCGDYFDICCHCYWIREHLFHYQKLLRNWMGENAYVMVSNDAEAIQGNDVCGISEKSLLSCRS